MVVDNDVVLITTPGRKLPCLQHRTPYTNPQSATKEPPLEWMSCRLIDLGALVTAKGSEEYILAPLTDEVLAKSVLNINNSAAADRTVAWAGAKGPHLS